MQPDYREIAYGSKEPLPVVRRLKAGSLTLEVEQGSIRYVSLGGFELIRSIYSAVRDRDWGTLNPEIHDERFQQDENGFQLTYSARYRDGSINFLARYRIAADATTHQLVFEMDGEAITTFEKNRIGFCVLHPLEGVRGCACEYTDVHGVEHLQRFPELISADSPMMDIAKMKWANDKALCVLEFEGDTFEMEDHRNWTDSSFKTFCTPLRIPYPVRVERGTRIRQAIRLMVTPLQSAADCEPIQSTMLCRSGQVAKLPQLGTLRDITRETLVADDLQTLAALKLEHLRHDLWFSKSDWREVLRAAITDAQAFACKLELVMHFTVEPEQDLKSLKQETTLPVDLIHSICLLDGKSRVTTDALIRRVLILLRQWAPDARIGGGTDGHFAEFNRCSFDSSGLDFVSFTVTPQIHAFDLKSLVENLESQQDTVRSARQKHPGREVAISPITLKPRFNVYAKGEEPPVPDGQLPPSVDPRQRSLFAAGWLLGCLRALVCEGTARATLFESVGWRGLIQGCRPSPNPETFPASQGEIFPLYHLLRWIRQYRDQDVEVFVTNRPLHCSGLIIHAVESPLCVVANHTGVLQDLVFEDICLVSVNRFGVEQAILAGRDPAWLKTARWIPCEGNRLQLQPFELAFCRWKGLNLC